MSDIRRLRSKAAIDYEADLLTSKGKGGRFSSGYLANKPLIEYLNTEEIPLVVFYSKKDSPTVEKGDNVVEFPDVGRYRSIGVLTESRILLVTGNESGDVTYSFQLTDVESVSVSTKSGLLSTRSHLIIRMTDGKTVTTHQLANVDSEEVAEIVAEKANELRCSKIQGQLEQSARNCVDDGEQDPVEPIEEAFELSSQLTSYRDSKTGEFVYPPKSATGLQKLQDQIATAQIVVSALKDIDETIHVGTTVSDTVTSSFMEANEIALERLHSLQSTVEMNELPYDGAITRRIEELTDRLESHRPSPTHERLHELLKRAEETLTHTDRTDDLTDQIEFIRTSISILRKYQSAFQEGNFTPGSRSEETCEICNREITIRCETTVQSETVQTCVACRSFRDDSDGRLKLGSEVERWIEDLEARLGHTLVESDLLFVTNGTWESFPEEHTYSKRTLQIASLICLTNDMKRIPSFRESERLYPEFLTPPGNYYQLASDLGLEVEEHFLDQLQENYPSGGLAPTIDELFEKVPYPRSRYENLFGSVENAVENAGLDIKEPLLDQLREAYPSEGLAPTTDELLERTPYSRARYYELFGSFEDAVEKAGLQPVASYDWVPPIREYYSTHGRVPSWSELQAESDVDLGKILEDTSSWQEALLWAGIPESDASEHDPVSEEILRIEDQLEHRPTVEEVTFYLPYGNKASNHTPAGKSLADLLEQLPLQYHTRSLEPTGELDETPDSSSDIPSHTDLLRELLWLVQRHGSTLSRSELADRSMFDILHYQIQFGSLDTAIDHVTDLSERTPGGAEYAPRAQLADELKDMGEFIGRPPKLIELLLYGSVSVEKFGQKFESMAELCDTAGYSSAQSNPSNEELISDLKRVAVTFGSPPLLEQYASNGSYPYEHFIRRFDDWFGALRAAGFSPLTAGNPVLKYHSPEIDITRFDSNLRAHSGLGRKEALLDEIHRIAYEVDGRPTRDTIQTLSQYPISLYTEEFGSVQSAIKAADLSESQDIDPVINAHLRGDLRTALQTLIEESSHPPLKHVISAKLRHSPLSYVTIFGSFNNALSAVGYDPERLPSATKPELSAAVDSVIDQLGDPPTPVELARYSRFSGQDFHTVFGSWQTLYHELGVEPPPGAFERRSKTTTGSESASESASEETSASTDSISDKTDDKQTSVSRTELIEALKKANAAVDGPLKSSHLNEYSAFSQHQFTTEFGSIDEALERSGIDRRTQCLDEIGFVIDEIGQFPNQADVDRHARVSSPFIIRQFGNWHDVLTSYAEREGITGQTASDELLLGELERIGANQADPVMPSQIVEESVFSLADFTDRFGTWQATLSAAGINVRAELLDSIRRMTRDIDGPLTETSLKQSGRFDIEVLVEVFGSLEHTIEVYIEETEDASMSNSVDKDDSEGQGSSKTDESDSTQTSTERSREEVGEPATSSSQSNSDIETETREDLIEALRELHTEMDHPVMSYDISEKTPFTQHDYVNEFGSLDDAFEEAHIDREESYLEELHRVVTQLGEFPSKTAFGRHAHISHTTLVNRLGGWEQIRADYMDWVEDTDDLLVGTEPNHGSEADSNSDSESAFEFSSRISSDSDSEHVDSSSPEKTSTESIESATAESSTSEDPVDDITFSELTNASQIDQTVAVKVVSIEEDTSPDIDALLRVMDRTNMEVPFRILSSHSSNVEWTADDWYAITEFWIATKYRNGKTSLYLLSTDDFTVHGIDEPDELHLEENQRNETHGGDGKNDTTETEDEDYGEKDPLTSIDEQLDDLLGNT